jgi:CRP-like cAMP-binding protein
LSFNPNLNKVEIESTAMSEPIQVTHNPRDNNILATLNKTDFERILPDLQLVELPLGLVLSEAGDHVEFVHFPVSGIVSLIYDLENGSSSEIAIVGNEGMIGISIYMGGESLPSSTEVQCPGYAFRLSRKILKREFALGGQIQRIALLYTQALIAQTSQTAVCNQHHSTDERFSRWLLMTIDRMHDNEVFITQELISKLLGVRRESVSETSSKLQKEGLITCTRGCITLANRKKLEERVCECYATVTEEYERLLPKVKK